MVKDQRVFCYCCTKLQENVNFLLKVPLNSMAASSFYKPARARLHHQEEDIALGRQVREDRTCLHN